MNSTEKCVRTMFNIPRDSAPHGALAIPPQTVPPSAKPKVRMTKTAEGWVVPGCPGCTQKVQKLN